MINLIDIISKKNKEKITVLTAYNYLTAKFADEAGIDIILVGDSLGMVELGYESTIYVTMEDMIHHTKAVNRARKNSFIVVDMPYLSYNIDIKDSLKNAGRLIQETGANAVKLEGGKRTLESIKGIIDLEIPVMGHLGLTPQSINKIGKYGVHGKIEKEAEEILNDALELEKAGVFSIVLEAIPENLAKLISENLKIPTIGIGAGKYTDGQVLVCYDMLGYNQSVPKFVKKYADLNNISIEGIKTYINEVKSSNFPNENNIYNIKSELNKIY